MESTREIGYFCFLVRIQDYSHTFAAGGCHAHLIPQLVLDKSTYVMVCVYVGV